MKKWAPYKSLKEQETFLNKMLYEKNKQPKPLISEDKAEIINRILTQYQGQILKFTYYEDGYLYQIEQTIKSIDMHNKVIRGSKIDIIIKNIIDLEQI
ncbi:MAG: YolD-like family protein [Bacilli bacterium]|nr:YolD-like family protein [Bacilli bacterium]